MRTRIDPEGTLIISKSDGAIPISARYYCTPLAIAEGMDNEAIETALGDRVCQLVTAAINDSERKFWRSVERARERLHFIGGTNHAPTN